MEVVEGNPKSEFGRERIETMLYTVASLRKVSLKLVGVELGLQ